LHSIGFGRRLAIQGRMRPSPIVQRDDGTPTGPRSARFFIDGILGRDAWFVFMRW
jgi:hypothetical protein